MRKATVLLAIAAVILAAAPLHAQEPPAPPHIITGRITANGLPVGDGTRVTEQSWDKSNQGRITDTTKDGKYSLKIPAQPRRIYEIRAGNRPLLKYGFRPTEGGATHR